MHRSARLQARTSPAAVALLVAAGTAAVASPPAHAAETAEAAVSASSPDFETKVLRNVNRVRVARDLHRVKSSACLDGLAEPWAAHLAAIEALVHRDQTVVLTTCSLSWAGEDLGSGSSLTPRKLVGAWMKSPAHRKVLLKPRARRAAVGTASADDTMYVVLNMGDPS